MTIPARAWQADFGAKTRREEEAELQRSVVAHLRLYGSPHAWGFMVNNGGKKSPAAARRDREMGLRAGTADLAFTLADGKSAYLELKSSTGVLSKEQKVFRDWCEAHNVPYVVASDIDYALGVLRAWGVLPAERGKA